ncbi:TRAP-type C4-dicarboxylate transport system permease small subunit [Nitrobacteraceae bacterium AZCC 2161]
MDATTETFEAVPAMPSPPSPLDMLDTALVWMSAAASIAAGVVLTYSVVVRHVLLWSPDWTDEVAVFLLVGATFLSTPYVQARRGHLGIGAVKGLLPPRWERARLVFVDLVCLTFAATFAWLCIQLLVEAVQNGEVSDSRWAPPLWFPYSLLACGMALLALRLLAQVVSGLTALAHPRSESDQ